ncbi:MAG: Zn-ribbon domain-containing OB-fold protein [Candidatus Thorarchaeota archaeon]|jgi:uncharacterized OB-fold protein
MNEIPTVEAYQKNIEEGNFRAFKCLSCGTIIAPPSGTCYGCGGNKMAWTEVSGNAKLVSFTVIHVASDEFREEVPYIVAIVELEEGTRISSRLIGVDPTKPSDISLGMNLVLDYEKGKSGRNYLAFKPA